MKLKRRLLRYLIKLAAEQAQRFLIEHEGGGEWQAVLKAVEEFLHTTKGWKVLPRKERKKLDEIINKYRWYLKPEYKPRNLLIADITPGIPTEEGIVLKRSPKKRWYVTETTERIFRQPANLGALEDIIEELREIGARGVETASDVWHPKTRKYVSSPVNRRKTLDAVNKILTELDLDDLYRPYHTIKRVIPKSDKWEHNISLAVTPNKLPDDPLFQKKPHFIRIFLRKKKPVLQSFHYISGGKKEDLNATAVKLLVEFQKTLRSKGIHRSRSRTKALEEAFKNFLESWRRALQSR